MLFGEDAKLTSRDRKPELIRQVMEMEKLRKTMAGSWISGGLLPPPFHAPVYHSISTIPDTSLEFTFYVQAMTRIGTIDLPLSLWL
jgi:hypothetical protein